MVPGNYMTMLWGSRKPTFMYDKDIVSFMLQPPV